MSIKSGPACSHLLPTLQYKDGSFAQSDPRWALGAAVWPHGNWFCWPRPCHPRRKGAVHESRGRTCHFPFFTLSPAWGRPAARRANGYVWWAPVYSPIMAREIGWRPSIQLRSHICEMGRTSNDSRNSPSSRLQFFAQIPNFSSCARQAGFSLGKPAPLCPKGPAIHLQSGS